MKMRFCAALCFTALAVTRSAAVGAQTPRAYLVEDVVTLTGSDAVAVAMNNNGDLAGTFRLPDGRDHAFRWTQAAGFEDLGANGGRWSEALDINDNGDVVGRYEDVFGNPHGFVAPRGGAMRDLYSFDHPIVHVSGIANDGRMAGTMVSVNGAYHLTPIRILADGTVQELGLTVNHGWGVDINDAGQVTGFELRTVDAMQESAFRASFDTGTVDLGTLGGAHSRGVAINNSGVVVGWSESNIDGSWSRAFRARPGFPMEDLGSVCCLNAGASAINDAGTIVGWSDGAGAIVYTDGDGMISLNSLVPRLPRRPMVNATAINHIGQILAQYKKDDFTIGTVRLTPIADTEPPVITSIYASPDVLYPPDGRMVEVSVSGTVTDNFDPSPSCALARVTNSEAPASGPDPDVDIVDGVRVRLRAARLGVNTGRTYTITVNCRDRSGNVGSADAIVRVLHDRR